MFIITFPLGTYLSLIKTIEIEEPTYIEQKSNVEIINLRKFIKISEIIQEIQRHQENQYNFVTVDFLATKLQSIDTIEVQTEKTIETKDKSVQEEEIWSDRLLYKHSLQIEPKFSSRLNSNKRASAKV